MPILNQKDVTLVFTDSRGGQRKQSAHLHNQSAGDLLEFLGLPQDGQHTVLDRKGKAIGLDEKVYDRLDPNTEVRIELHPDSVVRRNGGPNIFPVDAQGLPVALNPAIATK